MITKKLQQFQELILVLVALLLLGILAAFLSWGVGFLAVDLNKAIAPVRPGDATAGFNLDGAQNLNLNR